MPLPRDRGALEEVRRPDLRRGSLEAALPRICFGGRCAGAEPPRRRGWGQGREAAPVWTRRRRSRGHRGRGPLAAQAGVRSTRRSPAKVEEVTGGRDTGRVEETPTGWRRLDPAPPPGYGTNRSSRRDCARVVSRSAGSRVAVTSAPCSAGPELTASGEPPPGVQRRILRPEEDLCSEAPVAPRGRGGGRRCRPGVCAASGGETADGASSGGARGGGHDGGARGRLGWGKAQTPRECGTAVASLQNAAVATVAAGAAIVLLFSSF
jgi:hypothetical protein